MELTFHIFFHIQANNHASAAEIYTIKSAAAARRAATDEAAAAAAGGMELRQLAGSVGADGDSRGDYYYQNYLMDDSWGGGGDDDEAFGDGPEIIDLKNGFHKTLVQSKVYKPIHINFHLRIYFREISI